MALHNGFASRISDVPSARVVDWISVPLGVATLRDQFVDVDDDAASDSMDGFTTLSPDLFYRTASAPAVPVVDLADTLTLPCLSLMEPLASAGCSCGCGAGRAIGSSVADPSHAHSYRQR